MEGPIAILGARSFLGTHLVQLIKKEHPELKVHEWVPSKSGTSDNADLFVGKEQIEACLSNVKLIINCHEARDLSLHPNIAVLAEHNQEFVALIRKINSCPFVHVSTVLVQCSNFWPNTYEPEREAANYSSQWPCKSYCQSKFLAEQAVFSANDDAIVLRIPFLYGEGDNGSIVTDAIRFSDYFSSQIPNIGDHGGAFQMAYVLNIASGIEHVARKLLSGDFKQKEIMILGDDTPIGDPYSTVIKPFATNPKRQLSATNFLFLPLYYLYLFITWLLLIVNRIVDISHFLVELPDPSLLYLVFHHWTLFNTNKASFLLSEYTQYPRLSVEGRSRTYYGRLNPSELITSWTLRIDNQ